MRHLKIRNKLIFIYIVCVFAPIVLTNVMFYNVTTNNIKNQKRVDSEQAITQLKQELGAVIDDAAAISYLYSFDKLLNNHLNTEFASYGHYVESLASVNDIFNRSEKEYKRISSAVIISDNPTILTSGNILRLDGAMRETDWYQQIESYNNTYPHLYVTGESISIIQKISDRRFQSYEHIAKIDLNMDYIRQLIDLSSFSGDIYFLNPAEQIRYSSLVNRQQGNQIETNASMTIDEIVKPDKSIDISQRYQNSRYLGGWTLYGVLDVAKILYEVRQSGQFILWFALINFLAPTIIITMISRSIHTRIQDILKHMKSVRGKNFDRIPYNRERDEVGEIAVEFNRMSERIENLINDVYVADIQKKELEIRQRQAQLHALYSQINPHFLFNALETIRMRSLMKGETDTARTIHNMARIFRKAILWKRGFVAIREELELIESFLEIQKYRFDNKLQYHITVEQSLLEHEIPKMSFLPFVENASIHGIEHIPGVGYIHIQIAQDNGQIVFVIADNGVGMSHEKIAELHHYFHEDNAMGDSVGMKNVLTRLKICYGDSFAFTINSNSGEGTRIMLRLPMK
jgi:two-component system sensor histidine kinase YesM